MDNVFKEEQKHLDETENRIDSIARKHYEQIEHLSSELDGFYTVDYNDIDEKRRLRRELQRQRDEATKYEEYKPSPYFGRLDLENDYDSDAQTLYIGKKGLVDGTEQIIVDWRSPIGEFFYVKTEKEFKHDNYVYNLLLRRSLQIENEQLIEYNTEYDSVDISLSGDVIDPFLLTVLKDKRRQNRLTDIIKTIQGNQNTIIRKPEKESFIVQGCAGSGKTMILLHRLSYLAFNNRYKSYDNIKIITPNKFFDMHINELSRELGLAEIERLTVEEFYVNLIKAYSSKINVEADVDSEKTMKEDFLREIYSVEFQSGIIDKYNRYWDEIVSELKSLDIFVILGEQGISLPADVSYTAGTYELLSTYITKMLSDSSEANKKIRDAQERVEFLINQNIDNKEKDTTLINNIKQVSKGLIQHIDEVIAPHTKSEADIREKIRNIEESIQTVKSADAEIGNTNSKLLSQLSEIEDFLNEKINVEMLNTSSSSLRNKIQEECQEQIKKLQDLNEELKSVPIYNFAKRSRIKKNLAEINDLFNQAVVDCLSKYKIELTHKTDEETKERIEKQKQLKELENTYKRLSDEELKIKDDYKKYILIKNAFETSDTPNLKEIISQKDYKEMLPIIQEYVSMHAEHLALQRKIKSSFETIKNVQEEILKLEERLLPQEKQECLEKGCKCTDGLSSNAVYKNVFLKEMRLLYKNHKEKYSKNNYRHKIYLKLLYSMLYFKKAVRLPSFINIDEAQDLSIAEYRLLKEILGQNCVFNLYGDVNQLVYSYKGINDWEEIQEIIDSQLYFLNENYRNTIQITEYCNNEFEAEIFPIGISGKDVEEKDINQASNYILSKIKLDVNKRNAIIYRSGVKSIKSELEKLLPKTYVSWDKIDDKKISIITVEQAKGIEFDNVVVVADQMTTNERYIAYTRALEELVVVNDKFIKNVEEEYVEEDILDDDIIEIK